MGDFATADSASSHNFIRNMKNLNKMIDKLNLAYLEHLTKQPDKYTFLV